MWGATIFDQLSRRIMFHQMRYEGTFTPPSLQGTIVFPGNLGMFEWGGIAVDPVRQIAIRQPDRHSICLEAPAAGSGQSAGPERLSSAGQRDGRPADVRNSLRPATAPVPFPDRPALQASALGLYGRYRPEDDEDRVDAPERHDPGRGGRCRSQSGWVCRTLAVR